MEGAKNIELADPNFNVPSKIDILLGAECGRNVSHTSSENYFQTTCYFEETDDLKSLVERFWQIDDLGKYENALSSTEKECLNWFNQTTTQDTSGRFMVSLPRKLNASELGESKQMALHRFFGLEKRLSKNASLKNSYSEFMNEYLALGHMETVKYHESEIKQHVYYLPHHAVIRENSSTTKLRVVSDTSARTTSGKSLNDI
ncbi:uncharacterized protein LOC103311557 [Acyrthosiphon pisum]|uniref:Uncharacterized protein n=1 Tax=Acyrthosiphon pisum TaxID=7029 RepID=A0A8R2FCV2_ACYPI|nr:uncharacterized protein LOC103311557 [Acyrthosiphon pisum]|eukprot:XP_008189428.1 PREDICTED: uncharacterized protein LOC103311557 [Acyrthosiphon pisum]